MPIPVVVPRLGWTMEQGVFVEWLKRDGDLVKTGEPVFVLEGEKATQDIESIDAGILRIPASSPKAGDVIAVGATIGYLLAEGESWTDDGPSETSATQQVTHQVSQAAADVDQDTHASDSADGDDNCAGESTIALSSFTEPPMTVNGQQDSERKSTISPRALRVAQELGVDWTQVQGTGSTGRIRESDIRAAAVICSSFSEPCSTTAACHTSVESPATVASTPPESAAAAKPVSTIRRTIADRMLASAQTTAAVTITTKVDATHLVALRKQFQSASAAGEAVPTYTDILIKLVSIALKQHPNVNSYMDADASVITHDEAHIGVAVDTAAGLYVPVLRSVGRLTLRQIAIRSREMIDRTRQRSLSAFEMQGGTFTITNMGMFGVDSFTPLLNPPQAAILGVGRIVREPAVVEDQIVARDRLTLSLTFDHRILDGAPAARFLDTLTNLIANPAPALIT